MMRYTVERSNGNWRVTDTQTDSRVATCYLESNAELVARALNELSSADPNQLDAFNPRQPSSLELYAAAQRAEDTVGHNYARYKSEQ